MWLKRVDTRRPLVVAVVGLSALAWLALWLWGQSPYSRFLGHHDLGAVRGNGALMLVFVAGWVVMVVAMMLPTSLPLIVMFNTMTRQRPDRRRLAALLIGGYLLVWTLFGVAVYAGDAALHRVIEANEWLEANAWRLGALALILAGVYQFTPLKHMCLEQCRSPLSFITTHWHGRDEARSSFALGAHHGLFCVGCCWSLMLLMFAVGAGSLGWMLVLGAVMAVEKNVSWGRRLVAPLGLALIACGVIALAFGAPAEHAHTHLH